LFRYIWAGGQLTHLKDLQHFKPPSGISNPAGVILAPPRKAAHGGGRDKTACFFWAAFKKLYYKSVNYT